MGDDASHLFGDDSPKANPWTEDRLGYAPFAKRLCQVVIGLAAPNGYVVGLHGRWGSGKSTAVNFVLAHLKKHNDENESDQVLHIDFRPWIVAGHQDLTAAFFKVLSEKLKPKRWKPAGFLRRLFASVRGTTDTLVDAAATLALTVDPSGGIASRYAAVWAKKSTTAALGRFLDDPSVQASYEKLKAQLGGSKQRFFVTIDDIDRLEAGDIRSIMQMVKSVGQLPNVTYLLCYDRRIVANALGVGVEGGPYFAEKIIQQELELPYPSKNALLSMLNEEVAFLTADTPETVRWQYILRDGVHRWIRSPRDVVRLANAVKFLWPAIAGEVDAQDVLAMEGLRLFDSVVFDWVRENRDLIFHEGRFMLASETALKEASASLKSKIPEAAREPVLKLLSVLLPRRAEMFNGGEMGGQESQAEVSNRRGVGSEAGFDTYFGLHPSAEAVPKTVIDDVLASDDPDHIEGVIRRYLRGSNRRGEWMAGILLEDLRNYFASRQSRRPHQALLEAIFRVGDDILRIRRDEGFLRLSPRSLLGFLVRSMLERWDVDEAGSQLLAAFGRSNSPGFMADIYVTRGRELGIYHSTSSERAVLSTEAFGRLGVVLLPKIKAGASDGSLASAPFYFDIVRAWRHLAGIDAPRAWLTAGIKASPEFMAKVGIGLLSYSLGGPVRRYTMRDRPEPDLYDLAVLADAGKRHLRSAGLDPDTVAVLTEVVRGSEQLLLGYSAEATKDD